MKARLKAISIGCAAADTVWQRGFTAHVVGSFDEACDLATEDGGIVALVHQRVGKGPLNIVVDESRFSFQDLSRGLPAILVKDDLILGDFLSVFLGEAQVWEPRWPLSKGEADQPRRKANLEKLWRYLAVSGQRRGLLVILLGASGGGGRSLDDAFLKTARRAMEGLMTALRAGDAQGIAHQAGRLVGLGPGLTPAGDDYLIGLMWGLRAWPYLLEGSGLGVEEVCKHIWEAVKGRTTLLSAAFLRIAREGLPNEAWEDLLVEVSDGDGAGMRKAVQRALDCGAMSGADALAGFLSPFVYSFG